MCWLPILCDSMSLWVRYMWFTLSPGATTCIYPSPQGSFSKPVNSYWQVIPFPNSFFYFSLLSTWDLKWISLGIKFSWARVTIVKGLHAVPIGNNWMKAFHWLSRFDEDEGRRRQDKTNLEGKMFEFSYSGSPPYGRFDNTIISLLASYLRGGETAIRIFSLEETPLLRQTATFWNPTLYLFGHPNTNLVPRVSHLTAPLLARSMGR